MQIGAVLPQTEIATDMSTLRDYAQAMQDLGYQHLVTSDHVLGANPDGHPGWTRPQRHTTVVHEPFVLFGFIAGVAPKLGVLSNVVIMPQRQTVLVAKQAAQVDVLTEGRLRSARRLPEPGGLAAILWLMIFVVQFLGVAIDQVLEVGREPERLPPWLAPPF